MPRKNVEEHERCRGKRPDGRPCFRRAKFPRTEPTWCFNCDPSDEAKAKRRAAGAVRYTGNPSPPAHVIADRQEYQEEKVEKEKARQDGTLDDIVERALNMAQRLERIKPPVEDTLGAARIANAISGLYRQAIAGLRARGIVGDILPGRERGAPAVPGAEAPVPAEGAPDPMAGLRDGLDS
jgi:hypothetical protein